MRYPRGRRSYGRGRRLWPARLVLVGAAVVVIAALVAAVLLATGRHASHSTAGGPSAGASSSSSVSQTAGAAPAAPIKVTSCSSALPGTPQYVACQVTAKCFELCGSTDPASFLTSVRGLMDTQSASDLLDQASFASRQTLTSSQTIAVSACVDQCSLQVKILSAALERPNSPQVTGWIQYVLTQTGGHWQVSGYVWRAGDSP
jgi:hypothetical protein